MHTPDHESDLRSLAEQVGDLLHARHLRLVTAESCTGGWVAKALTDIPGSSSWFERGFVTYSNESKQDMLGVAASVLQQHGAVSEAVVRAMADGALQHSRADLSLAITGIAGPGGGSELKPVGLVWFAWAGGGMPTVCESKHFSGGRELVRHHAAIHALLGILNRIRGM